PIPHHYATAAVLPLGEAPEDRTPISGVLSAVEAMLRQPRRIMYHLRQPGASRLIAALLIISVICALTYGVVVGRFSRGERLWIAPVKIVIGLLLSALICLPSLYIFSCLSG